MENSVIETEMKASKWILPLVLLLVTPAFATTYTLVGSWEVDQGPRWTTVPAAYTGQEAAALLFGGTASDYLISVDSSVDPSTITDTNWVSIWGIGSSLVPQDYIVSTGGLYASPGDTSAYVSDWALGSSFTNYAWQADVSPVPEPSSLLLLGSGLLGFAGMLRRKFAK
jgi:hypothetical protein